MGTTSAMVGAYILAGEIGKHCARENSEEVLEMALTSYESVFMPFMTKLQSAAPMEDSAWDKVFSTSLGIGALNILLGAASLLKVNIAKYMLKGDVKGWELPKYEELSRG
jgi:hypothetical protein